MDDPNPTNFIKSFKLKSEAEQCSRISHLRGSFIENPALQQHFKNIVFSKEFERGTQSEFFISLFEAADNSPECLLHFEIFELLFFFEEDAVSKFDDSDNEVLISSGFQRVAAQCLRNILTPVHKYSSYHIDRILQTINIFALYETFCHAFNSLDGAKYICRLVSSPSLSMTHKLNCVIILAVMSKNCELCLKMEEEHIAVFKFFLLDDRPAANNAAAIVCANFLEHPQRSEAKRNAQLMTRNGVHLVLMEIFVSWQKQMDTSELSQSVVYILRCSASLANLETVSTLPTSCVSPLFRFLGKTEKFHSERYLYTKYYGLHILGELSKEERFSYALQNEEAHDCILAAIVGIGKQSNIQVQIVLAATNLLRNLVGKSNAHRILLLQSNQFASMLMNLSSGIDDITIQILFLLHTVTESESVGKIDTISGMAMTTSLTSIINDIAENQGKEKDEKIVLRLCLEILLRLGISVPDSSNEIIEYLNCDLLEQYLLRCKDAATLYHAHCLGKILRNITGVDHFMRVQPPEGVHHSQPVDLASCSPRSLTRTDSTDSLQSFKSLSSVGNFVETDLLVSCRIPASARTNDS